MNTITCPHCGTSVAEDELITGICPVCDNHLSKTRKNRSPESDEEEGFLEIMDKLDRGEFR